MTNKMISKEKNIGFSTWTKSNEQFEKSHFNEYQLDLTTIINMSPELLEGILNARSTLGEVELLDESDVFGD